MEIQNLTFNQLPEAVSTLLNEVNQLKQMLAKQNAEQPAPTEPENDLITIKEACELLQVSRVTLHRYEKQNKVKVYGIGARRLLKRSELLNSLILKK
ncbi:MAG: helix-turn-helix domain-containing protein [Psychroflexus halocasei]